MARKTLERLDYYGARNWFWIRTAIWMVPAALISVMAHFVYTDGLFETVGARAAAAALGGCGSVLLAALAGCITMQLTWMRFGWRISFVLNGPACALIAALVTVITCGIIMTFLKSSPPDPVGRKAEYDAWLGGIERVYELMVFSTGASAFWGFVFGSWFAMRRDKYFIEPFLG